MALTPPAGSHSHDELEQQRNQAVQKYNRYRCITASVAYCACIYESVPIVRNPSRMRHLPRQDR